MSRTISAAGCTLDTKPTLWPARAARACFAALRMREVVDRYADQLRRMMVVEAQISQGSNMPPIETALGACSPLFRFA
jgi:hypothetical protein